MVVLVVMTMVVTLRTINTKFDIVYACSNLFRQDEFVWPLRT